MDCFLILRRPPLGLIDDKILTTIISKILRRNHWGLEFETLEGTGNIEQRYTIIFQNVTGRRSRRKSNHIFLESGWELLQVVSDCVHDLLDNDPGEQVRLRQVPDCREERHALA